MDRKPPCFVCRCPVYDGHRDPDYGWVCRECDERIQKPESIDTSTATDAELDAHRLQSLERDT